MDEKALDVSVLETYKVAVVQDTPVYLNADATVEKACRLIKVAADNGAKLVVFPEAFISGYPDWVWVLPPARKDLINELYRRLLANSVSVPGDATEQLARAAREAGVFVTIGVNERNSESSGSSIFNSLLYFGPEQGLLARHRKLVPTGGERLMWSSGGGDSLVSCNTSIGRLGGLICWENFMPLARTSMYMNGVQVYVAPTWDSSEAWQVAMRYIAREGGMYVIGCAPCMTMNDIPDEYKFKAFYPDGREFVNKGNSCVAGPDGKLIAGPIESKQTILYADIDLRSIPDQKWLFDVAGHYSRPDVFNFGIKNT
jgi:nitrilase